MEVEKMPSIDKNYIIVNVIKINQFKKGQSYLFIGKIKFKDLDKVHKLTERVEDPSDPFNDKKQENKDQEFQRHLNEGKLKKILKYLSQKLEKSEEINDSVAFQTPLILAGDLFEDNPENITEAFIEENYSADLKSCFISEKEDKIYIPRNNKLILIVDGQHRFYGLKKLYEELDENKKKKLDDFEFSVNFVLGLDIFNVGEIFATINFEQKPVNKSLYYDIFGSIPDNKGKNDIKLAHDLTLHMQNNEESPLNGMIKLLGRGKGYFSQAFFVENLIPHFRKGGVWRELYLSFIEGKTEYKKIAKFLKMYFKVIKKCYNEAWVKEGENRISYNFILNKTTGMSAFLRLIKEIFPLVRNEIEEEDILEEELTKIFSRISSDDANLLFVSDLEKYKEKYKEKNYEIKNITSKEVTISSGMFGKSGSVSQQSKLYSILKENLL
jgi:DGQHR domain-containing protein